MFGIVPMGVFGFKPGQVFICVHPPDWSTTGFQPQFFGHQIKI
jgi:hypothetical protein